MAADKKLILTFPAESAFQKDVRQRVDSYFAERGIIRTGNGAMFAKAAFWLLSGWALHAFVVFGPVSGAAIIPIWAVIGFLYAGVGFNVSHDAVHGSFSQRKWVNDLMSWSFDINGVGTPTWAISHNLLHHTYTNVPGTDSDIEPGPALRFHPQAQLHPWHRFQAIYAWILYSLTSALWFFHKDFYQGLKPHPRSGHPTPAKDWGRILVGKVVHSTTFIVLPLMFTNAPVWMIIAGYFTMHAVCGLTLAIVFQLAHVVEGVRYPLADSNGRFSRGWMEHEMVTTANFGNSWLCNFITGGLDHQVEHHLFPRVCHIHYPALAPIVKQCAADHGLPYLHSGSFLQALAAHTRMLGRLGRGEDVDFLADRAEEQARPAAALLAAAE